MVCPSEFSGSYFYIKKHGTKSQFIVKFGTNSDLPILNIVYFSHRGPGGEGTYLRYVYKGVQIILIDLVTM